MGMVNVLTHIHQVFRQNVYANSADPDQTASAAAVCLGLHCHSIKYFVKQMH